MCRHAHLWPLKCAEACSLVTPVLYKYSLGFSEMIWNLFAHLLALLQTSASHRFGWLRVGWNKPLSWIWAVPAPGFSSALPHLPAMMRCLLPAHPRVSCLPDSPPVAAYCPLWPRWLPPCVYRLAAESRPASASQHLSHLVEYLVPSFFWNCASLLL